MKKAVVATLAIAAVASISACGVNDADVVSENISTAADNFEIARKITFINNQTGDTELEIYGLCNIVTEPDQLEVTCMTNGRGVDEYKKHFLGLNAHTHYVVEQIEGVNVSKDHYRVTFNPSVVIPNVNIR